MKSGSKSNANDLNAKGQKYLLNTGFKINGTEEDNCRYYIEFYRSGDQLIRCSS